MNSISTFSLHASDKFLSNHSHFYLERAHSKSVALYDAPLLGWAPTLTHLFKKTPSLVYFFNCYIIDNECHMNRLLFFSLILMKGQRRKPGNF